MAINLVYWIVYEHDNRPGANQEDKRIWIWLEHCNPRKFLAKVKRRGSVYHILV